MENTKIINKTYIYYFILFLYILLVFIVGYNHEPWGDEAQSWLIARDNGYIDIFFKQVRYEGHPFLWFFIEKIYINIGSLFTSSPNLYNWVFILPLIFSSIGIYFLLFKSNLPMMFKIIFPFTFYPFFQLGVIARSHSLYFALITIIATLYPKKFEHPIIYTILLFLCANISAYSFVISIVLLVFFVIEAFLKRKEFKLYKLLIPAGILLLGLIWIALIIQKPDDSFIKIRLFTNTFEIKSALYNIWEIYFPIKNKNNINILVVSILTIAFYITTMKIYCKNLYQYLFFISLNLSLYLIYIFLYIRPWHYSYAILTLLFSCWVLSNKNNIKNISFKRNWLFYIFIIYLLGYHTIGNIQVSIYDIKYDYDGAKKVAKLIKKYHLQKYKINGYGFKTVAIQPYFEKNIYKNYHKSTHFIWSKPYLYKYNELSETRVPIMIADNLNAPMIYDEDFINNIKEFYDLYEIKGELRGLNYKNGSYEDNSYRIYINKKLSKKLKIKLFQFK